MIHSDLLTDDNENLEIFTDRDAIRVTTVHAKKQWIVQAFQSSLDRIRRHTISLRSLVPSYVKGKDKWIYRYFDNAVLQEVARLTNTSITRKSKSMVYQILPQLCQ